jgi:hypothetical protein
MKFIGSALVLALVAATYRTSNSKLAPIEIMRTMRTLLRI